MENISHGNKYKEIILCYYLQRKICFKILNSDGWEELYHLIITQDDLIKEIAEREDINVATVRRVFRSAEDTVFDYLSSTTPTENIKVKLLNGLSIDGKYIFNGKKNMLKNIIFKPRIAANAKLTRYYNKKLNSKTE